MKVLLLLTLLGFTQITHALIIPDTYRSGVEVCSEKEPKIYASWLEVPVSYQSERGFTDLYTWTKRPFDPTKPSVIFVSGGPGDTAHQSFFDLPDWNIIFFDQRGNSCSRPRTKELYLDPAFYSSENTARDMEEIRKAYKLQKVSVYGVSYGTVPAHLYGHFFGSTTRGVVLEGVIFRGGEHLMQPASRMRTLQRFFDELPGDMQERILTLSTSPAMPTNWFSMVGMMMLYLDHPLEAFRTFLDGTIWEDQLIQSLAQSFAPREQEDVEFGFGHVMMGMIGCQELGMNDPDLSFYSIFNGRLLVSDNTNHQKLHYCESLGFSANSNVRLYEARQYPIRAPITYLQGALDGATAALEARLHFKHAAHGPAQLLIAQKGGHIPIYGTIASGYSSGEVVESRLEVLRWALSGKHIPNSVRAELETHSGLGWRYQSK